MPARQDHSVWPPRSATLFERIIHVCDARSLSLPTSSDQTPPPTVVAAGWLTATPLPLNRAEGSTSTLLRDGEGSSLLPPEKPIQRWRHNQRQERARDQPANHHCRQWPLHFRARAPRQRHRNKLQRRHQRGHQHRTRSREQSVDDRILTLLPFSRN